MTKTESLKNVIGHDTHPELPLDPDAAKPGTYKWPPHFTPSFILIVFVGGCFGAAARYGVSLLLPTPSHGWPVTTMSINLLGAFLLGLLLEGLSRLGDDSGARRSTRLFVGAGFMGAFTTYSTMATEIVLLLRVNNTGVALWYAFTSVIGGVAFSALGIWLAASHHEMRENQQ